MDTAATPKKKKFKLKMPGAFTILFFLTVISVMLTWSFPNKRILRNNLCLPACKLLYLDKREKNFLLTDIISDIIIVRN